MCIILLFSFYILFLFDYIFLARWDEACASTCTLLDADPQLNTRFLLPKVRTYRRGSIGNNLCIKGILAVISIYKCPY